MNKTFNEEIQFSELSKPHTIILRTRQVLIMFVNVLKFDQYLIYPLFIFSKRAFEVRFVVVNIENIILTQMWDKQSY